MQQSKRVKLKSFWLHAVVFSKASAVQATVQHSARFYRIQPLWGPTVISHPGPTQRPALSGFWQHLDISCHERLHLNVRSRSFHPSYVCKYRQQAPCCREYCVCHSAAACSPEKQGVVWGNICNVEMHVMAVRMPFWVCFLLLLSQSLSFNVRCSEKKTVILRRKIKLLSLNEVGPSCHV